MSVSNPAPNIFLRALEPSDVDCMYLWENDPEVWPFGGIHAPVSRHQLWEYANNYDANPFTAGQLRLIIEIYDPGSKSRVACGVLDLYDIDAVNSRTQVGIMVAPAWRGRGIAATALRLAEDYCRDRLGLSVIAAEVACDNLPSMNLFGKKRGFELIACRPSWFRRGDGFVEAALFQKSLR